MFKFPFFTRLTMDLRVSKTLLVNHFKLQTMPLRKYLSFDPKVQQSAFILCKLFLCPLFLKRPENCPQGCLSPRTFFSNVFFGVQKSTFSTVGYAQFCKKMAKIWNFFKFAFFTRLTLYGPQGVENITWESFLNTNNTFQKILSFHP